MDIYGIHPVFRNYFLAGAGLCSIFAVIGIMGSVIWFVIYRHRIFNRNKNTGWRPPIRWTSILVIVLSLLLAAAGIFGITKTYLQYHWASVIITRSPLPALITSTMREERTPDDIPGQKSYKIIYVTITPSDPSHSFPPMQNYRVDTGVDNTTTEDPGWVNAPGYIYLDKHRDEVVMCINYKYWYAQKWNIP